MKSLTKADVELLKKHVTEITGEQNDQLTEHFVNYSRLFIAEEHVDVVPEQIWERFLLSPVGKQWFS